jgi:hypothetical protein
VGGLVGCVGESTYTIDESSLGKLEKPAISAADLQETVPLSDRNDFAQNFN